MTEEEDDTAMLRLAELGKQADADIDLAAAALVFAARVRPGLSLDRYAQHLRRTGKDVAARHLALLKEGASDDAATRLAALKHVLADVQGLEGAQEDYDRIDNADLTRVIDTRRGLPVALAILYIDAGRRQGWAVDGLNMPGHFVLRIDHAGQRLIFDPFHRCRVLQAPDLRQLVKQQVGPAAELSASYYESCSNRQILMRLQNNIKLRQVRGEDYEEALWTVRAMRLAAPDEYRLLLDEGVLCARTGRKQDALDALTRYMAVAPDKVDRHDAALLLQQIRDTLS